MSGHSKWAKIHRAKGAADQARGKVFQKLAKELYVAARGTNGNIDDNPSLRMVVEKCRSQNMPKDNIQKAIDKACKSTGGEDYETIRYEGYAPSGIAIMVDCLTDNRNRTASFVRSTFTKRGGNLGTDGSVSYLFNRMGVIEIEKTIDEDDVMMTSLDSGAEDIVVLDDSFVIYTSPENFLDVKKALEDMEAVFITSEITYVASNTIKVDDDETMEKVYSLIDALEEIDDVNAVYHNMSE